MSNEDIALGADPEFFLIDTEKSTHVSAHDLVPGDKKNPHKLKDGAVQVDGVAVEFNINPAFSAEEFEHNMNSVLDQVRGMIPKRYAFDMSPVAKFPNSYFKTLPDVVKELGCSPDFSAVRGGQENLPPKIPVLYGDLVPRTAAGHLHVGWTAGKDVVNDEAHALDCLALANFFHKSVGYVLNGIETKSVDNSLRKTWYGNGGAYRIKPYGVELRSPSNTWVQRPKLYKSIYNVMNTMVKKAQGRDDYMSDYKYACSDICYIKRHVLNGVSYNRDGYLLEFKSLLKKVGFDKEGVEEALNG